MALTIELTEEQTAALEAKAQAVGVSAEEFARQVLARDLEAEKPVWEIIADIMKDVPPEVMATLPKDGASQHDHYIYGWPKREE